MIENFQIGLDLDKLLNMPLMHARSLLVTQGKRNEYSYALSMS